MNFKDVLGEELAAQVQKGIDAFNEAQTDKAKQVKFVDLSDGEYVTKYKLDDKVKELTAQIETLNGQLTQRDTDLKALNEQLTSAQADAGKLQEAQQALTKMQSTYEADKQAWEQQKAAQAYEFAIRSKAGELKFSSNAAKNDFIRSAIEKGMALEGEKIHGFDEYLNEYREADPGAFAAETLPGGQGDPKIVLPGAPGGGAPGAKMTLAEAMQRANAGEKIDISAIE